MSLDMLIFGLLALVLIAVVIFATTGRRSGQQQSSEFDPAERFAQLRDKGRSNLR